MKNYEDILRMAVKNEIEAYEFYKDAAKRAYDSKISSIFKELANEELKHRVILEDFIDNKSAELVFDETQDYKISESVEARPLSTDLEFKDAITLAMKKEEAAMNMYQQFADASQDTEQKETFLELVKMERGHKSRLEEIYTNAAHSEVW